MKTERFSEGLSTIKDAIGKLESLVSKKPKKGPPPTVPSNPEPTKRLETEQDVLAALQERVALQCIPGLWDKVQDSMKAIYFRDERRVWRQIVAAVRANDEAEASRLARAAGIPAEFLKS
jgi:hypothetical protein